MGPVEVGTPQDLAPKLERIAKALERIAAQMERSKPVAEGAVDKTLGDNVATISAAENRPRPAR